MLSNTTGLPPTLTSREMNDSTGCFTYQCIPCCYTQPQINLLTTSHNKLKCRPGCFSTHRQFQYKADNQYNEVDMQDTCTEQCKILNDITNYFRTCKECEIFRLGVIHLAPFIKTCEQYDVGNGDMSIIYGAYATFSALHKEDILNLCFTIFHCCSRAKYSRDNHNTATNTRQDSTTSSKTWPPIFDDIEQSEKQWALETILYSMLLITNRDNMPLILDIVTAHQQLIDRYTRYTCEQNIGQFKTLIHLDLSITKHLVHTIQTTRQLCCIQCQTESIGCFSKWCYSYNCCFCEDTEQSDGYNNSYTHCCYNSQVADINIQMQLTYLQKSIQLQSRSASTRQRRLQRNAHTSQDSTSTVISQPTSKRCSSDTSSSSDTN